MSNLIQTEHTFRGSFQLKQFTTFEVTVKEVRSKSPDETEEEHHQKAAERLAKNFEIQFNETLQTYIKKMNEV